MICSKLPKNRHYPLLAEPIMDRIGYARKILKNSSLAKFCPCFQIAKFNIKADMILVQLDFFPDFRRKCISDFDPLRESTTSVEMSDDEVFRLTPNRPRPQAARTPSRVEAQESDSDDGASPPPAPAPTPVATSTPSTTTTSDNHLKVSVRFKFSLNFLN